MSATLNDLDIANPLSGSTIDELAAEVRNLKTIIKNVLLVAHNNDGSILGATITSLPNDIVTTASILDANVTAGKLAADAVETAKIKNSAVTGAKLAAGALNAGHFSSLSGTDVIPYTALGDASIPMSKLAGTITAGMFTAGCVETADLADASVTDDKIVSLATTKLTGGTDGQTLVRTGGQWLPAVAPALPSYGIGIIGQLANTDGGDVSSAATWTKRMITEHVDTGDFMSIFDSEITFLSGSYFMFVRAPGHEVKNHQIRLVKQLVASPNTRTVIAYGSCAYAFVGSTDHGQTDSFLIHLLTVSGADETEYTYSIEHYFEVVAESDDLGEAMPGSAGGQWWHTSGFIIKLS